MKKGHQIKSYLTYHPRITGEESMMAVCGQINFNNYLSALGVNYESIYKVSIVLVNIHLIRILIQKVIIRCVISASKRCVFKIIKVTRFKIQLIEIKHQVTLKSWTY